jgi:hypothetical protein
MGKTLDGATLAYPSTWTAIGGDRGSVSAALRDRHGGFLGYLNLTPRQGDERQANWASFRLMHNRAEGDGHVRLLASAYGLGFSSGRGACVKDSYDTVTGKSFVEIACLVGGRRPSVIVGASPPSAWLAQASTIELAISSVRT